MDKARILVVEDEALTALEIQRHLEDMGHEVPSIVASGEEAIQKSKEINPDLVLMDIQLQGKMDGIDAATSIKDSLHVPVVYLTAYSDKDTLARAKVSEPFGYLLKPLAEEALAAAVEISLYKAAVQSELRKAKENFAAVLECVGEGIITVNLRGMVEYLNPAAKRLLETEDAPRPTLDLNRIFDLHDGASGAQTRLPIAEVSLRDEAISLVDQELLTSSGKRLTIDLDLAPLWDLSGLGRGVVIAFREVSARHRERDSAE